jgi:hypothetical protein
VLISKFAETGNCCLTNSIILGLISVVDTIIYVFTRKVIGFIIV